MRFFSFLLIEVISEIRPKIIKIKETGLFIKIEILPLEIDKAVLRFLSSMGPRIKANKKIGGLNSFFFMIYPSIPKNKTTFISKTLKLIPYVPTQQNIIIKGNK